MSKTRGAQLVSAVVFLLTAAAFTFNDSGVQWVWRDTPGVGVFLAIISLAFWVFLIRGLMSGLRGED